jgi:hypothetical protein
MLISDSVPLKRRLISNELHGVISSRECTSYANTLISNLVQPNTVCPYTSRFSEKSLLFTFLDKISLSISYFPTRPSEILSFSI